MPSPQSQSRTSAGSNPPPPITINAALAIINPGAREAGADTSTHQSLSTNNTIDFNKLCAEKSLELAPGLRIRLGEKSYEVIWSLDGADLLDASPCIRATFSYSKLTKGEAGLTEAEQLEKKLSRLVALNFAKFDAKAPFASQAVCKLLNSKSPPAISIILANLNNEVPTRRKLALKADSIKVVNSDLKGVALDIKANHYELENFKLSNGSLKIGTKSRTVISPTGNIAAGTVLGEDVILAGNLGKTTVSEKAAIKCSAPNANFLEVTWEGLEANEESFRKFQDRNYGLVFRGELATELMKNDCLVRKLDQDDFSSHVTKTFTRPTNAVKFARRTLAPKAIAASLSKEPPAYVKPKQQPAQAQEVTKPVSQLKPTPVGPIDLTPPSTNDAGDIVAPDRSPSREESVEVLSDRGLDPDTHFYEEVPPRWQFDPNKLLNDRDLEGNRRSGRGDYQSRRLARRWAVGATVVVGVVGTLFAVLSSRSKQVDSSDNSSNDKSAQVDAGPKPTSSTTESPAPSAPPHDSTPKESPKPSTESTIPVATPPTSILTSPRIPTELEVNQASQDASTRPEPNPLSTAKLPDITPAHGEEASVEDRRKKAAVLPTVDQERNKLAAPEEPANEPFPTLSNSTLPSPTSSAGDTLMQAPPALSSKDSGSAQAVLTPANSTPPMPAPAPKMEDSSHLNSPSAPPQGMTTTSLSTLSGPPMAAVVPKELLDAVTRTAPSQKDNNGSKRVDQRVVPEELLKAVQPPATK